MIISLSEFLVIRKTFAEFSIMNKVKEKSLPLDKVLERIQYWSNEVEMMKNKQVPKKTSLLNKYKQTKDNNEKLLSFWLGYKKENFPNN